jgi:hypothetical protein
MPRHNGNTPRPTKAARRRAAIRAATRSTRSTPKQTETTDEWRTRRSLNGTHDAILKGMAGSPSHTPTADDPGLVSSLPSCTRGYDHAIRSPENRNTQNGESRGLRASCLVRGHPAGWFLIQRCGGLR